MKTVSCTQCDKRFTKNSAKLAEQALLMHVGRVHTKTIQTPSVAPLLRARLTANGSLTDNGNVAVAVQEKRSVGRPRGQGTAKLTVDERNAVLNYIRQHKNEHRSMAACFTAALKAAGVEGKIMANSTAVKRHFDLASEGTPTVVVPKRKYIRHIHQPAPVKQDIHINYCPNCGCPMHKIAQAMAVAAVI